MATYTRDKYPFENPFVALVVATIATAVPFTIAKQLFCLEAHQFQFWRQPRTEFAFHLMWNQNLSVAICIAAGFYAALTRRLAFPGILAFIFLFVFAGPTIAWTGPGDLFNEILPLINVGLAMPVAAMLINGLLILLWRIYRRRNEHPPEGGHVLVNGHWSY